MKARVAMGALAAVALWCLAPLAAVAATLPAGQVITVLGSDTGRQLYESTSGGVLTEVNPLLVARIPPESIDVDNAGQGYALGIDPVVESGYVLWTLDAVGSTLEDPIRLTVQRGEFLVDPIECHGLDYTAGSIRIWCFAPFVPNGGHVSFFVGSVAPGTGVVTPLFDTTITFPIPYFFDLALDPVSGDLYGIAGPQGTQPITLYRLSPGVTEPIGVLPDEVTDAIDFDRAGTLWATTNESTVQELAVVDTSTGGFSERILYSLNGDPISFIGALTVWGDPPALPATGPPELLPLTLVGGAALLIGVLLAYRTIAANARNRSAIASGTSAIVK